MGKPFLRGGLSTVSNDPTRLDDLIAYRKKTGTFCEKLLGHANFYVRENFFGWSSLYAEHVHPAEQGALSADFIASAEAVARDCMDKVG